jgi:hypothetical protein
MSRTGSSTLSQVLSAVAIVVLLYIVLAISEYIYKSFMAMWKDRVELFPDTYVSGSKMYTAIQNPQNPYAKTVYFSDNQRSGIEFTYSMFIYLNSDTFSRGEKKLHHIMHKGYNQSYPLMGPGIFCWGHKNTLRVYMNCYDTWDNYSDIDNIPVDKWFHIVVSCKGSTLFVYINGNLKQKVKLRGETPPYQNYGDVHLFSPRRLTLSKSITTSLENNEDLHGDDVNTQLVFDGSAKGMVSRVYYFSYAVTYTEINSLLNMAPSKVISGGSDGMNISPYLSDTWWVNREGP